VQLENPIVEERKCITSNGNKTQTPQTQASYPHCGASTVGCISVAARLHAASAVPKGSKQWNINHGLNPFYTGSGGYPSPFILHCLRARPW